MHTCWDKNDVLSKFSDSQHKSSHFFADSSSYLEKCIKHARHIEVRIFGDGKGNVSILGNRECSIQRRYQKIVEEAPSLFISESLRSGLFDAARRLGKRFEHAFQGTSPDGIPGKEASGWNPGTISGCAVFTDSLRQSTTKPIRVAGYFDRG